MVATVVRQLFWLQLTTLGCNVAHVMTPLCFSLSRSSPVLFYTSARKHRARSRLVILDRVITPTAVLCLPGAVNRWCYSGYGTVLLPNSSPLTDPRVASKFGYDAGCLSAACQQAVCAVFKYLHSSNPATDSSTCMFGGGHEVPIPHLCPWISSAGSFPLE